MSDFWLHRYIFAFLTSMGVSTVLTAISVVLFKKLRILDIPNERKIHTQPIPRMGGVAIFVAFVTPMLLIMYFSTPQKGVMIGAGITLIVGALDDLFQISAVIKLACLFSLTLLLGHYDIVVNFPLPHWANIMITMLWITGVTSAMNALDHMDGLAGGVSAIAATMYLLVSIQTNQYFWGLLSISLIGSLIGYLVFNRHPAKIFMGDSGSFFLGFTLATIGVMGGWSENPIKAAIVPIAVLSLPIFDLVFVIATRRFDGTTESIKDAIVYCGKDHIGHRLVGLGFTIRQSVRFIYLIAASIAFAALALRHASTIEAGLIFTQMVFIYIIIIVFMSKRQPAQH